MTVFNKVLRAASRLSRTNSTQAGKVIRDTLAATLRQAGQPGKTADRNSRGTLPCFGPPSSFDFSKGLDGLRKAADQWTRPSAPETGAQATEGGSFTARSYSGSAGSRRYKLFKPDDASTPRALVMMLHGCSQNPDDFAAGTRMNALARAHNLVVVYPEQPRSANPSGCWNWFDPKDQRRDAGEPAILAGIAREVAAEFGIPARQTFVAGLSAGGAMAAILAETYPDVFAAVGIHSGLPYGAAHDVASAFAAMRGTAARSGAVDEAAVVAKGVPVIVFHGDADHTVHAGNADAIVARIAAREAGLQPQTERGTTADRAYAKVVGRDGRGRVRFEHWTIAGAGHAWSGGSRNGSYTDPAGPDASAEMLRFFLQAA